VQGKSHDSTNRCVSTWVHNPSHFPISPQETRWQPWVLTRASSKSATS
jgi:hypothetical protein